MAVAGGTGLTGREVVRALTARRVEVVVLARSTGVDLMTGAGLERAVTGADAVVDVTTANDADAFSQITSVLLRAATSAGVRHAVLLSIVAAPRLPSRPHYAGKLAQERLFTSCGIPYSIVRATQYHEYGAMLAGWMRQGNAATLPDTILRPVAVADVGEILAEVACGAPLRGVVEVAGPEEMNLVACARRVLAARNDSLEVRNGGVDPAVPRDAFLPGPGARIAPTTFDAWLRRSTGDPPA